MTALICVGLFVHFAFQMDLLNKPFEKKEYVSLCYG